MRGSCRICVLSSLNRSLLERACATVRFMGLRLGCMVCIGVEQNEMDLASSRLLYCHTILGIVASNVVLAVVMCCLMLSFSLTKEYILKTNVHTNHIHKTHKGNSKISNLSRISPIPYVALKKPQSQPVPAATSSKSHKNRYLPQLYQGPLESTPIPPFTPLPPRPHSPTPPSVSHQKKRKRARKPA